MGFMRLVRTGLASLATIGRRDFAASSGSVPTATPPVVSVDWLAARLNDPNVAILDCSWYLPAMKRDARKEFADASIPGARFFDIDANSDTTSDLPHMLPNLDHMEQAMIDCGVDNEQHVVCYDGAGIFSAPRVWWTLRVFGHERVSVLDGGLPAWRAKGLPVVPGDDPPKPRPGMPWWSGKFDPQLVKSFTQMRKAVAGEHTSKYPMQIVDARPADRFHGRAPEPRPGCVSGHMPTSVSIPFSALLAEKDGVKVLADDGKLAETFAAAKVDLSKPITASCGSGVTACVIALAAAKLGNERVAVYDGSWAEWGSLKDVPIISD